MGLSELWDDGTGLWGDLDSPELGRRAVAQQDSSEAPDDWREWIPALFPRFVDRPFGPHHAEFWDHVWDVRLAEYVDPFISIWARGGAKSTSIELATVGLGARGRRRYALYVCSTQDSADKHVGSVSAMLESDRFARFYPAHADRAVGKFGSSRGWRRNRLATRAGFVVDAAGLDNRGIRGLKFEEQRPDLIVLDDLDDKGDTPAATAKKLDIIKTSILPAGSWDCMVVGVQNLIIPNGIFSQLSDGRADFLVHRHVSGPHPAIVELDYEWQEEEGEVRRAVITGGIPSWEGQGLEECQKLMDRIGLSAFLLECQHEVKTRTGRALRYDERRHRQTWDDEAIREAIERGKLRPFAGIDFGHWRFAFLLMAQDQAGRVHVLDELFSQRESLTARAAQIIDIVGRYGIEKLPIWGDAANPTDMLELNLAFRRAGTKLRVGPTKAEGKARQTALERLNDLLDRGALLFRRTLGAGRRWQLGQNAASTGTEMLGSRLMWEVLEWAFPVPKEGEAQKQDADDNTADGADGCAALKYGVMSWLKPADRPVVDVRPDRNVDQGLEKIMQRLGQ